MRLGTIRHTYRLLLAAALLLFLVLPAATAFAGPPTVTSRFVDVSLILPANPCPFPVRLDSNGHIMSLELVQQGGSTLFLANRQGDVTLTNTDNQKSVTLHLAEANHEVDYANGATHLRVSGGTLMWAQPPDFAQLTLLRGQRDRYYDANGNLISDVVTGTLTNVCDLLAG